MGTPPTQPPTLLDATKVWAKIGALSFGGPAGQIALMHREVVAMRGWLTEQQYLNALSFCMLLPGPEAMQLATYAGWRLHGVLGGLIAGLLFILPGALVILALATGYALFGDVPLVDAVFLGIKAAVVMIVIEALIKVAKRALEDRVAWAIAGLAFIGIFFLALPYPAIIAVAACVGFIRGGSQAGEAAAVAVSVSPLKTLGTVVLWLGIWVLPFLVLTLTAAPAILMQIAQFFSQLAVVTFGGAYAVLAYMAQDVVEQFGWLTAGQMIDGLGLAETTPGPLILVTQFVGFLAAFGGGGLGLAILGAVVTLWVTFAPCFLWIFAGAPYIEWIGAQPRLKGALQAITAAVVGVILNLSLWFALHVLFGEMERVALGPIQLWSPDLFSVDWRVAVIAAISGALLFGAKWPMLRVLGVAALCGLALGQL
ncbi:MAG: chromate efflux transporter [Alphaproteobacteria bacterium]|nr:chromate efflux transporter [Alphaproteobacteria bacterium SS10]